MLPLLLLLASLTGMVIAVALVVRGLLSLRGLAGGRSRTAVVLLRTGAHLTGATAVALYAWGLLFVGLAGAAAEDGGTDSSPIRPCREAGMEKALQVDGYEVDFIPLRFECHLISGGTYATSDVPGYVNPAVLGSSLVTAAAVIVLKTQKEEEK